MLEEVSMRLFRPLVMAILTSVLINGSCNEPIADAVADPGPLLTLL